MSKEEPVLSQPESVGDDHREIHRGRRCQSQLSAYEHMRSDSQHRYLPALSACCAHCKLPLLIDVNIREMTNKSRPTTTRNSQRLCNECTEDKVKNIRTPSGRSSKSTCVSWSNVGDKIETWFEKARTPDQRVVYNFLEQINSNQNKEFDTPQGKNLDDILNNLKKYRTRFTSPRIPKKFNRVYESTSWRVMRHASTTPRQYLRSNSVNDDNISREFRVGSVFTKTEPRVGSTFLLHPDWI